MSKYFRIVILFLLCLLLAGCQPTPESEAIVNKGSNELENKVLQQPAASPGTEASQADDSIVWNETKDVNIEGEGKYTVAVSVDAKVPELPVKVPCFLIEPKEFSIESMKNAAQYLMKGEIFDGKESKQDITLEILDFKKDISAHTILDGYQEEVDNYLKFMDGIYNNAVENNLEAEFKYKDREYGERGLLLKSYPSDNSIMNFIAYDNQGHGVDGFLFYINRFNRVFQYLNNISGKDIQANDTKVTYKEALSVADKAIETLFEDPFFMVHSNVIDIINHYEYLWNEDKETSEGQAYVFYYTREYGGIPSLFIDRAPIYVTEQTEYAQPYTREGACVVVDDRGIVEMKYNSYSDTVKTLNENVSLLPFDDILDKFKDGVFYHNLWGGGGTRVEINIMRIEFGMVREPIKDNPDQYMMVPAWNFIGNIDGVVSNDRYGDCEEKSVLALSAIDGSIITDYDDISAPK